MHARDDLGDASFNASLLSQVGDVFACFSDDNAGVLSAHKSAKSERFLRVRWASFTRRRLWHIASSVLRGVDAYEHDNSTVRIRPNVQKPQSFG